MTPSILTGEPWSYSAQMVIKQAAAGTLCCFTHALLNLLKKVPGFTPVVINDYFLT